MINCENTNLDNQKKLSIELIKNHNKDLHCDWGLVSYFLNEIATLLLMKFWWLTVVVQIFDVSGRNLKILRILRWDCRVYSAILSSQNYFSACSSCTWALFNNLPPDIISLTLPDAKQELWVQKIEILGLIYKMDTGI